MVHTYQVDISDTDVSVRFKIGVHTFALFINSLDLWSNISEQLSAIIKARYGTTGLVSANDPIALPRAEPWRIVYAKPKDPHELRAGWVPLRFDDETETPARSGLTDGCTLAFAVWPGTETRAPLDVDFVVDIPQIDDYSDEEADGLGLTSRSELTAEEKRDLEEQHRQEEDMDI
ncbi:hypothetical protein CFO_g4340 [Ceratocystis platani]|uniref:Uncharacterized protein n=1 Tax=Ceratocystis fimbriata f. sp. platani TaxID=88771 RepID=A0A0F8B168_CERFI|nr:hypothetical protein CFO_g4340 [Ceratocystis platani]